MSKPILTQEYLKKIITYDPETGTFVWTSNRQWANSHTVGYVNVQGYHSIMIDYKNYLAHRLAWLYVYGMLPTLQIDHINHNTLDNRLSNLRLVTNQENQKNRAYTGNSSGRIGVCFDKARNKWKPHIKINQKLINLGRFDTLEMAILVRKAAEEKYGFHPNHGINIIQ